MSAPAVVKVSRKGADRVTSGHPWIFRSDVVDAKAAAPGAAVSVADPRGRVLGTAHYSSSSLIALRMLSPRAEPVDREFLRARIAAAEQYRRAVVRDTEAYRVVHGEADLLPALIIDRYGGCLAIQTLDQGMDALKPLIVEVLLELFSPAGIVERNDTAVRTRESLPLEAGILHGTVPAEAAVRLNGFLFHANLLEGQKTGIYLDQRENYRAAAAHARGGGALDCFTSSGGFALHLAAVCESVEAVDSSAAALALARRNADANGIENVIFREADVFDLLAGYANAHRRFSLVVLDPPAFTRSRRNLEPALRGYKEINQRALRLLDSGGILVSCSCSHHIGEAALLETTAAASLDAGRRLRVLERRTQAADHPILLTVPETCYLKCLILQVV